MITTITTFIFIVSIMMALNGKEMLYVVGILFVCYSFPALAFIVITLAVLADYSN
jgi:hypothetical protein